MLPQPACPRNGRIGAGPLAFCGRRGDDPGMQWQSLALALVAVVAGALVAVQPGINGLLRQRVEHPIQASLISFSCGLVLLTLACLGLGQRLPRPSMLGNAPWWMWVGGGAVGAVFVTSALVVAPKIGAAYWVALIIAGQMLASLWLDQHGWLGFAQRPIGWHGLLGAMLVIAGAALISMRD